LEDGGGGGGGRGEGGRGEEGEGEGVDGQGFLLGSGVVDSVEYQN